MSEYRKIKKFEKYGISNTGVVINLKSGRILKQSETPKGYLTVSLYNKQRKLKRLRVHRLVYSTFKKNIQGVVNHMDFNKKNNFIDNLEDITVMENNMHWISDKPKKNKHTGIRKLSNGLHRIRIMHKGKVHETDKNSLAKALLWRSAKVQELGLSRKYQT